MRERCTVGTCDYAVHSWGLCVRHYMRLRAQMMRDGTWRPQGRDHSRQITCECAAPKWESCGPLFPTVRVCAWCGSPHPDEFGQPSPSVVQSAP